MQDLHLEPLDTVNLTNFIGWFDSRDSTNILFKESEALDAAMQGSEAWSGKIGEQTVAVAFFSKTVMNNGRLYFAVKPSMRRRGIGAKMMSLVLSEPTVKNFTTVQVNVEPENEAGQRTLRKTGFVLTGYSSEGLQEFEKL